MDDALTLPALIAELGDAAFAQRMGIKVRTAQAWRLGERRPNRENLFDLLDKFPRLSMAALRRRAEAA